MPKNNDEKDADENLFLLSGGLLCSMRREIHAEEHEHAVEHQQFITELISSERNRNLVYGKAYHWCRHADVWHKTVVYSTLGQYAIGKETKERA